MRVKRPIVNQRQRAKGRHHALIITPRYLPFLGGMERECSLLADQFSKLGYAPLVITEQLGTALARDEMVGSTRILRIPSSPARELTTQLRVAAALSALLFRYRNDVAFAVVRTFTLPALVVGLMKRLHLISFPTLVTAETGGTEDDVVALARRPLARLSRFLVASNDVLNGLCQANIDHMHEAGYAAAKISMIPNGIDIGPWDTTSAPASVRRFLFLGRIDRTKGVFDLIEAFDGLASEHEDVHLTFAGAGPAELELQQRTEKLGLGKRVRFAGRVSYEDLGDLFAVNDCLVLPSYSEGMPLSVLEAAAHHRVLILSDVGDMHRLFGDRALFCAPGDTTALGECLERAVSDEDPETLYDDVIESVAIANVARQMITRLDESQGT